MWARPALGQGQSLIEATSLMHDLDVGALPICGDDARHGISTCWTSS
jgi:hypothetical protein